MNEGYIKFKLEWDRSKIDFDITDINEARDKLYKKGLIGAYPNGIGFGNISIRIEKNKFLITGSETGKKSKLDIDDYSLVTGFDIDKNFVECKGMTKASSESLTHAAIYLANPKVNSVIHIHSKELWNQLKSKEMCTPSDIPYGTPGIAMAVGELAKNKNKGIIVMLGHVEGSIGYGKNLKNIEKILNEKIK